MARALGLRAQRDALVPLPQTLTQRSLSSGNAPVAGGVITSLAFSPDGQLLAAVSLRKTVILWEMAVWQPPAL